MEAHGGKSAVEGLFISITDNLPSGGLITCNTDTGINPHTGETGYQSNIIISRNALLNFALLEKQGSSFSTGHSGIGSLKLNEAAIAFGVEEMDHAVRAQKALRELESPLYSDTAVKLQETIEEQAKPLVQKAVAEFGLGKNKGFQR